YIFFLYSYYYKTSFRSVSKCICGHSKNIIDGVRVWNPFEILFVRVNSIDNTLSYYVKHENDFNNHFIQPELIAKINIEENRIFYPAIGMCQHYSVSFL